MRLWRDFCNLTMQTFEIDVLYADNAILVLDKPAGLLSVPGRGDGKLDCLSTRVQRHFPDALVVHRLDMATSGVMVFARGPVVQRCLNHAFASRVVKKRYIAIVDGYLHLQHSIWSVIDLPIIVDWPNRPRRVIDVVHGKPSITLCPLSYIDAMESTLIELEPVTGRSHQLRVHLLALGHAIVGDALYANQRIQVKSDRLLLHARSIEFPHPVSGQPVQFRSQDPF